MVSRDIAESRRDGIHFICPATNMLQLAAAATVVLPN